MNTSFPQGQVCDSGTQSAALRLGVPTMANDVIKVRPELHTFEGVQPELLGKVGYVLRYLNPSRARCNISVLHCLTLLMRRPGRVMNLAQVPEPSRRLAESFPCGETEGWWV